MTLATFQNVVRRLNRNGIPAVLTGPGSCPVISVRHSADCVVRYGANVALAFAGDVIEGDTLIETLESSIPSDSDNVNRIFHFITSNYVQFQENQKNDVPPVISSGNRERWKLVLLLLGEMSTHWTEDEIAAYTLPESFDEWLATISGAITFKD